MSDWVNTWQDKPVTVTLPAGTWMRIVACAASYDLRIPAEQGNGHADLDAIRAAVREVHPDA